MSMRLGNDAGAEPAFSDTFGKCRVRKAFLGLLWPIPVQFSTRNEKIRTRFPWDMDSLKGLDDNPKTSISQYFSEILTHRGLI